MKKLGIIITNRTNYSKLKHVMFYLNKRVKLVNILSSSSILEKFGKPFKDLKRDNFKIQKRINCVLSDDSHSSMANSSGLSMIKHADYFSEIKIDGLLAVGDRFDTFSAVYAAKLMNIKIFHIQGGEKSGSIDNVIRDLLSRISDYHFVSTDKSKENLIKLNIPKEKIFNFGCPSIDYIQKIKTKTRFSQKYFIKKFKHSFNVNMNEKYFILISHPDTTNPENFDVEKVLSALLTFKIKIFIFYPNNDAKNNKILNGLNKYKNNKNLIFIKHMPIEDYIYLMKNSLAVVGNSSSGIRETGSFGIPNINIGTRQINRERNENTIDVVCNKQKIIDSIKHGIKNKRIKKNIYFKKNSSQKIAQKIFEKL